MTPRFLARFSSVVGVAIALIAAFLVGLYGRIETPQQVNAQSTYLPPIFTVGTLVRPASGMATPYYVFRVVGRHGTWIQLQFDRESAAARIRATPGAIESEADVPDEFWSAFGINGDWWINMANNTEMWQQVEVEAP